MILLTSWAAALGAVLVLVLWVTAHEREQCWGRRWAHAALPSLISGCAVVLLTGYASWGMAMFLLVWMLSEKSTRPIAASMDNKHPRNYSHPDEAPGVDHARCWGQT